MRDRSAAREFERFVAGSLARLYRTAYLMTCDAGVAEDLCQDTLIKVARRWRRVRAMANPEAYTRRVLVNLVIDTAPRRRRSQEELTVDANDQWDGGADESIAITFERVHDTDELMRALTRLTDRQRQVLVLRYLADWSVEEVARRMNCSPGTVKSTTARATARLAGALRATSPEIAPATAHRLERTR
ncbi:MAG: SigE family RNA polymerase sigma factor [Solirubrobacteraceae bacterium]